MSEFKFETGYYDTHDATIKEAVCKCGVSYNYGESDNPNILLCNGRAAVIDFVTWYDGRWRFWGFEDFITTEEEFKNLHVFCMCGTELELLKRVRNPVTNKWEGVENGFARRIRRRYDGIRGGISKL